MKRILSLIVIVGMASIALSAKTKRWKPMVLNNGRSGMVTSTLKPVPVKGVGKTTASGVRYWDILVGKGNAAQRGHTVKVLYMAWVKDGKEFAGSVSYEKPTIFTLGAGQVIPGWEDGMVGMKAGGKRQIRIPPALAYGARGLPPNVPQNATLVFDIELVAVD